MNHEFRHDRRRENTAGNRQYYIRQYLYHKRLMFAHIAAKNWTAANRERSAVDKNRQCAFDLKTGVAQKQSDTMSRLREQIREDVRLLHGVA